jgi:hypothetical protein
MVSGCLYMCVCVCVCVRTYVRIQIDICIIRMIAGTCRQLSRKVEENAGEKDNEVPGLLMQLG